MPFEIPVGGTRPLLTSAKGYAEGLKLRREREDLAAQRAEAWRRQVAKQQQYRQRAEQTRAQQAYKAQQDELKRRQGLAKEQRGEEAQRLKAAGIEEKQQRAQYKSEILGRNRLRQAQNKDILKGLGGQRKELVTRKEKIQKGDIAWLDANNLLDSGAQQKEIANIDRQTDEFDNKIWPLEQENLAIRNWRLMGEDPDRAPINPRMGREYYRPTRQPQPPKPPTDLLTPVRGAVFSALAQHSRVLQQARLAMTRGVYVGGKKWSPGDATVAPETTPPEPTITPPTPTPTPEDMLSAISPEDVGQTQAVVEPSEPKPEPEPDEFGVKTFMRGAGVLAKERFLPDVGKPVKATEFSKPELWQKVKERHATALKEGNLQEAQRLEQLTSESKWYGWAGASLLRKGRQALETKREREDKKKYPNIGLSYLDGQVSGARGLREWAKGKTAVEKIKHWRENIEPGLMQKLADWPEDIRETRINEAHDLYRRAISRATKAEAKTLVKPVTHTERIKSGLTFWPSVLSGGAKGLLSGTLQLGAGLTGEAGRIARDAELVFGDIWVAGVKDKKGKKWQADVEAAIEYFKDMRYEEKINFGERFGHGIREWINDHPKYMPEPPDGFVDLLLNPAKLAGAATEMIPLMGTAMVASTVGGPVGGPAFAFGIMYAAEKDSYIQERIAEGMGVKKAEEGATTYGVIAAVVEYAQLSTLKRYLGAKGVLNLKKTLTKGMLGKLGTRRATPTLLKTIGIETLQEAVQTNTQYAISIKHGGKTKTLAELIDENLQISLTVAASMGIMGGVPGMFTARTSRNYNKTVGDNRKFVEEGVPPPTVTPEEAELPPPSLEPGAVQVSPEAEGKMVEVVETPEGKKLVEAEKPAPEETKPPTPQAKQPWEMGKTAFSEAVYAGEIDFAQLGGDRESIQRAVKIYHATTDKANKAIAKKKIDRAIDQHHGGTVTIAVTEGKPVPPEVLAEYPELAGKGGAVEKPVAEKKPIKPQELTTDEEITAIAKELRDKAVAGYIAKAAPETNLLKQIKEHGGIKPGLWRTREEWKTDISLGVKRQILRRDKTKGLALDEMAEVLGMSDTELLSALRDYKTPGKAPAKAIDAYTEEAERELQRQREKPLEIERLNEAELAKGDEFTVFGEKYKVTDTNPTKIENDHAEVLDDFQDIPIDKGSLKKAEAVRVKVASKEKPVAPPLSGDVRSRIRHKISKTLAALGRASLGESLTNEDLLQYSRDAKAMTDSIVEEYVSKKSGAAPWLVEKLKDTKWVYALQQKATEGEKGVGGRVGTIDTEPLKLSLEPIRGKPISARKIIDSLSRATKVTIRGMATHRSRVYLGWYDPRAKGIRQKNIRSITTAIHEIGHHVDWYLNKRISKKPPSGMGGELLALGRALYGEKKPPGGYKSEGFAQFIRGYLSESIDVEKDAPNTYKWFTQEYLPNNKDIAKAMETTRKQITQWRLQGAEARFESMVNRKALRAPWQERIKTGWLWWRVKWTDRFAPLKAGLEEAGVELLTRKRKEAGAERLVTHAQHPYELAVMKAKKAGSIARHMVMKATVDVWGRPTGKSLHEILKPVAGRKTIKPFTRWIMAARIRNLAERKIDVGFDLSDVEYIYKKHDNPEWQEIAKEITSWNDRCLEYVVQAGGLSAETAKAFREANPIYVPLMVAFVRGERVQLTGVGGGLLPKGKVAHRIKGSGREKIDPFEAFSHNLASMINIADKTMVARALVNLEGKYEGLANLIWKVPPPKAALRVGVEKVRKQLEQMGVKFPAEMPEEGNPLLTIYMNSPIFTGSGNVLAIPDGKGGYGWYEVSPQFYSILKGLDRWALPRFLNLTFGKLTRAIRLGATGLNASFGLLRNPIRDAGDTLVKAEHARGPLATVRGFSKELSTTSLAKAIGIKPSKAAEAFDALGGKMSGYVGQDRRALQHLRGEMLANTVGKRTIHTIEHPIDALRGLFSVPEASPRIQELDKAMDYAVKKLGYGEDSPDAIVYAFNKAQDQTINYTRAGQYGEVVNSLVAFWNSNSQDVSKHARNFKTRPLAAVRWGITTLTLPALGLWWLNKDEDWYKNLDAYGKYNYLYIPVGKDKILRLPVPFISGHIFQGLPIAITNALYEKDPSHIADFFGEVFHQDVKTLLGWPSVIAPIIHVERNKDWAGRPIIPASMERKLPDDQYKEYTSEICKGVARALNYTARQTAKATGKPESEVSQISPLELEYIINSWSGGLYRRIDLPIERLLMGKERKVEAQLADIPVVGALFVRDPFAPRRQVRQFYDQLKLLDRKKQSKKITPQEYAEWQKYSGVSKALSPHWKALRDAKTTEERKEIYKKIKRLVEYAAKS